MNLDALLTNTAVLARHGDGATEVLGLAYDSRQVKPGWLFFAIQGEHADGHQFIGDLMRGGAAGVVSERPAPASFPGVWIQAPSIRQAMAEMGRAFYGDPVSKLQLTGITGTNGKTTTAHLLHSVLKAAGRKPGLFGTIEYRLNGRILPAHHTTPESLDLLALFADLAASGGNAAVMEVSSHALAQDRVWGFRFAAAVFTNLTRDHLDYHKDFDHYFAAKRRLFEGTGAPPPELAVINADDPWGQKLLRVETPRKITYAVESEAQVKVTRFTLGADGIRASIAGLGGKLEIASPLMGRANLENILAAAATAEGLGIPLQTIQDGVAALRQVPGRFERVDMGQPFIVLVDYAHTHDALRNALAIARELAKNRLLVVFGCGGDRDRSKRPLMGEAAGSMSDLAVLTSDNPRGEDPITIMNDAMVGLQKAGKPYLAEVDRGQAIREALGRAHEGDVVLLAGKGHETVQVLRDGVIPFDDREVARRVLKEMGFKKSKGENGGGK